MLLPIPLTRSDRRYRALGAAVALLLAATVLHAEPACTSQTPINARCEVSLDALRPTQPAVGMIQVEERVKRLAGDTERIRSTAQRAVPVVQAPDGSFYLTDGHHQASVLYRLGMKTIGARIVGRLRDPARFWEDMQSHRWVYLYDPLGRPIPPSRLPRHIADLGDDPYRSVAGYAEDAGYFRRTDVNFAEFDWARYFGMRMGWQPVDRLNLLWAVLATERLACDAQARDLPGYIGPCRDR